ncbi:calcium-binding protein [Nocardioides sp. L-11A]|uniref:calcium-binding protein n=1 Tax=Nocardioides sp. L-11A TaxID=3043848 RepID=UPI00249B702D|nr:calcium-binding protein [Nocardioides sp. L-11A]
MRRHLLPVLALALALPASVGISASAEAAKPRCGGAKATIVGTNKADRIKGTKKRDVIVARGGNDRIKGLGGNDVICGGGGNDTIDGGAGQDWVHGGAGRDLIALGPGNGGIGYGDAGDDTMATGAPGQALYGGEGNDLLKTSWPVTLVNGEGGDDTLIGGPDADQLNGGDGNDHVSGGGGDDVQLNGGFGVDTCDGGPGRDQCNGGAPGGPENSPGDPDICTAEVMRSCRGDALPERWAGAISGVTRLEPAPGIVELATWTLDVIVVKDQDFNGEIFYRLEEAEGTYSATRASTCSFDSSGPFDEAELWADLRVRKEGTGFYFELGGPELLEVTLVCPESQRVHLASLLTGGRVLEGVRNPETGRIVGGSRLDLADNFYREWQFDLAPVTPGLP